MGNDQDQSGDTSQFEWVNAWAAQSKANVVTVVEPVATAAPLKTAEPIAPSRFGMPSRFLPSPNDQLMRDIAEIEPVRDRLAAILVLVPARTTDPVPVVIGGVLALVMLAVFGAAAAMSKLSR